MDILEKLPTFLTVGALVIIFACLKRHARCARLTSWAVGWALVFTHFLAQLLEPDRGHVSSLLLAIDSVALQAAAVAFLVSVSSVVEDSAKRTTLLLVLGVPALFYSALFATAAFSRFASALALCPEPDCMLRRRHRIFLSPASHVFLVLAALTLVCSLVGAWAIRAAFGDPLWKVQRRCWALDLDCRRLHLPQLLAPIVWHPDDFLRISGLGSAVSDSPLGRTVHAEPDCPRSTLGCS